MLAFIAFMLIILSPFIVLVGFYLYAVYCAVFK
jgi:hypothetical protein